ncbi:unnamed protein product [Clonostachys solani]|uniref:Uncharacterized protein n=1 Tax=Clonostachys solani TaxID=160281 RepID=A0A9N9YW68_9HYPO|nr:unnamed protein product [Clonostachys solani]
MDTGLPRPIAPMALSPSNELHRVEMARKALQKDQTLTNRQSNAMNKAIELLSESKKGGRNGRYHSRDLLLDIYHRFGIDVLLLCSASLSITKLGEMKRNATQFFCELGAWKMSAEITPEVHDLAMKLLAPVLSEITAKKTNETEALESDSTRNDGKGKRKLVVKKKPTPAKRRRVGLSEEPVDNTPGPGGWRVQHPTPNEQSVDANSYARTECDESVKEESQTPPASHSTITVARTSEDGEFSLTIHGASMLIENGIVPLYATVVKLKTMDILTAIVLQGGPDGYLTIPDNEGLTKPFITIQCPMPLALGFKANKEPMKWS